MRNRKGEIKVLKEFFLEDEGLKVLSILFSKFIPFFITEDFNGKVYYGVCKEFREVELGEKTPVYDVSVVKITNEESKMYDYSIQFKEIS